MTNTPDLSHETAAAAAYTADDIVTTTGLAIYRSAPTQYITDTEHSGITFLGTEILDNAWDEALWRTMNGMLGVVRVGVCIDAGRGMVQIIIKDNGRGLPLDAMHRLLTTPNTSGKSSKNGKSYVYSAGRFGNGAKVSAALSQRFRAVTKRPEGIGSLRINSGVAQEAIDRYPAPQSVTGTTMAFEPDATIFGAIDTYGTDGYIELIQRLQKLAYFSNVDAAFILSAQPLPEDVWTCSPEAFEAYTNDALSRQVLFTTLNFNRHGWLRAYLDITSRWDWSMKFAVNNAADIEAAASEDSRPRSVLGEIEAYVAHNDFTGGGWFGLINNIPIDAAKNDHLACVSNAYRTVIADAIDDASVRGFFLNDYRLPIYFAVSAKFEKATFTGTTKHAFYSADFRAIYTRLLLEYLRGAGQTEVMALVEVLMPDIITRYKASLKKSKKGPVARWELMLNNPKYFTNCNTQDRTSAELFIIEGQSAGRAGNEVDRDTMAIWTMRGKPYNPLRHLPTKVDRRRLIETAQSDPLYADLILILGLDPANPDDLSNLRFGRIIICADADSHGRHIAALLVGFFSVMFPRLLRDRHIHVITPPYFAVYYGTANQPFYVRRLLDYDAFKIKELLEPNLQITLRSRLHAEQNAFRLHGDLYLNYMLLILHAGEMFELIASELAIPAPIVEMLARVTTWIYDDGVNLEAIRSVLGDDISYEERHHVLVISMEREEYNIPLRNVNKRLYTITPILNTLRWMDFIPWVKTINSQAIPKETPATVTWIYAQTKTFDRMFKLHGLKGLGSMNSADRVQTCMDPRWRLDVTTIIDGVGDVNRILDLLGKDPVARKHLVANRGALGSQSGQSLL